MTTRHKTRYRDRIAALMALANARHKDSSGREKLEQRAYRCSDCGVRHLTSKARWRRGPGESGK